MAHLHLLAVSHYHQAQQHTIYFLTVNNALIWFVTPRILWFFCKVDPSSQQIGITGVVNIKTIFFVSPDHLWRCITRSMEQFHLFWLTTIHVSEMFKFVKIFFVDVLVLDSYHLGNWSLLHPQLLDHFEFFCVFLHFKSLNRIGLFIPIFRIQKLSLDIFVIDRFFTQINQILNLTLHNISKSIDIFQIKRFHLNTFHQRIKLIPQRIFLSPGF